MKLLPTLAIAATVIFSSCATNDLSVSGKAYVPADEIKAMETYAWSSKRSLNMQTRADNTASGDAAIMAAIDRQLAAKGYRKVDAASADLLAGYSAASRRSLETRQVSGGGFEGTPSRMDEEGGAIQPWNEVARGTVDTMEFEEGTLFIDITDRKTGKLLYRGEGRATLLKNPSDSRAAGRINNAVTGMLRPFPSRR